MKITIESEALDSLKQMVEQLQIERDEAIKHLEKTATYGSTTYGDIAKAQGFLKKFRENTEVM